MEASRWQRGRPTEVKSSSGSLLVISIRDNAGKELVGEHDADAERAANMNLATRGRNGSSDGRQVRWLQSRR